jgi:hypothetical protein
MSYYTTTLTLPLPLAYISLDCSPRRRGAPNGYRRDRTTMTVLYYHSLIYTHKKIVVLNQVAIVQLITRNILVA